MSGGFEATAVIGHRGAGRGVVDGALENTPASFELAARTGADWIEIDVRRTADDRLVLFHNAALDDGRAIVDLTEEQCREKGIRSEVGRAYYRNNARGQIIGDHTGLLKLIFHLDTHELLGVHILGEGASELVHIGQAVMAFKGKVEYFINNVFNYPTLAECYKTAAFDGINRLGM